MEHGKRPLHAITVPEIDSRLNKSSAKEFLIDYTKKYDINLDKQAWFEQIKQIAVNHNFAADNKEYKANPTAYAGNIADACNLVRVAVTGKTTTPDLCSIMQLLGKEKVINRINNLIKTL